MPSTSSSGAPRPPVNRTGISRAVHRFRSWPRWVQGSTVAAAAILSIGVAGAAFGDRNPGQAKPTPTELTTPTTIAAPTTTEPRPNTTTTAPTSSTTTVAPTTTTATTATTVPPTPPPTPVPPPPPPPSSAVATPPPSCDPNYTGACVPIASDVDCAGGKGNGPAYVSGPVTVVGVDIYDLDRDGDGTGCE